MQLYADEDFPLGVVEELRRLGHDVVTAQEDGRRYCGKWQPLLARTHPEKDQQAPHDNMLL
jgi:hypothetical protein